MKKSFLIVLGVIVVILLAVWLMRQPASAPEPAVNYGLNTPAPAVPSTNSESPPPPPVTPTPVVPAVPSATAPADTMVSIKNFTFTPSAITVKAGGQVTWTNNDSAPHRIVITGAGQSPDLAAGQSWTYTFSQVGDYNYVCGIHPAMQGQVIVVE